MRQFFYLVVCNFDENTLPRKVFLQESEAIRWGRREATKDQGPNREYSLYKQEIARTATLSFVKTLKPFETTKGVDLDIDNPKFRKQ